MRKIISGMLGIVMTASVLGGVAYAAFSSTASVEGVSFSAGDADLRVWDGSSYVTSFVSGWTFSGLYPGYVYPTPQAFWLKNVSTVAIDLDVKGKLRDGVTGPWAVFKNNVQVAITDFGDLTIDEGDWHDLEAWNAGPVSFAAGSNAILSPGEEQQYQLHVRVKGTAGSELENQTLESVEFDFTGTQTP